MKLADALIERRVTVDGCPVAIIMRSTMRHDPISGRAIPGEEYATPCCRGLDPRHLPRNELQHR
jgi:hypothetical protein